MTDEAPKQYLFVGGPFDGTWIATRVQLIYVDGPEYAEMAYHKTRPTNTNWREEYDPDWWIKNMPEPKPPEDVFEWHSRSWVSPEVAMIWDAVEEATERVFGRDG